MKAERIKDVQQIVASEIEFRLAQQLSDSEHDMRTLTVIVDFHNGMPNSVLSRVETKRVMK